LGEHGGSDLPKRLLVSRSGQWLVIASQPGKHSPRVGLDDWLRLIEGNRGDSRSGVAANSRKLPQFVGSLWKNTSVPAHQLAGGSVQLAGPTVVAQAFPGPEYVGFGGSG
jgi:hypothetical protein